jgi:general secretion pathway protein K
METAVTSDRKLSCDGFVIVAVLWILGALAFVCSIYATYVINTTLRVRVNDERVQSEALVVAALELTAYQLSALAEKARPAQGAFAFHLGQADVGVDFRSEAGRIDINAAPKELLAGLFSALGAKADDANYYADRIIAWRTATSGNRDQDKEVSSYRTAGLSYGPREAPFQSIEELWYVMGLPTVLVEHALPYVTIFSGKPDVNVLAAAPEVIAAVPGMTPDRLDSILNQRGLTPQNGQTVLGAMGTPNSPATQDSKSIHVSAHVQFANGRRINAEVVMYLLENDDNPYRIFSWYDDFDG